MYVTTKDSIKVYRVDTLEIIMEFPRTSAILFALAENRIYRGIEDVIMS